MWLLATLPYDDSETIYAKWKPIHPRFPKYHPARLRAWHIICARPLADTKFY